MNLADRIIISLKGLRQLGGGQLGLYAAYQFGLSIGHYRRELTSSLSRFDDLNHESNLILHPCLPGLPDRDAMLGLLGDQIDQLYTQADEIVHGMVRLFGGAAVPLVLDPPYPLLNWTNYEHRGIQIEGKDIKYIWEPGRFGWACTLAMAYYLSNDERYEDTFWQNTEHFLTSNPAYLGPHWSSAQEVAIRLVALAFALQVFISSKQVRPDRLNHLAKAIATHAERIPPTLVYARSQNNNHLISEALGLYTASALLPEYPLAPKWHALGWKWLLQAFRTQIDQDGTYSQHSTNYHRLMLQAAVWAFSIHNGSFPDEPIPEDIINRLKAASRWLWKYVDPESGRVPNLGHNDGAYILPLTVCPFHDYRPVIHAAELILNQTNLAPRGYWNDLSYWLSARFDSRVKRADLDYWHGSKAGKDNSSQPPHIILNHKNSSWAYLRVAHFLSRPAHADQLHLDLWWRGLNLAQDPGTYLYNGNPPWDNSLTSAFVHNTMVVDDQDFMLRAGRFLYLDWAQAEIVASEAAPDGSLISLTAQHNGYRKFGLLHTRKVGIDDDGHWQIIDHLEGSPGSFHSTRVHWLLPDWKYEIQETKNERDFNHSFIRIQSPFGWVSLEIGIISAPGSEQLNRKLELKVARAGQLVYGSGDISPIMGWVSPTYGEIIPALSFIMEVYQSVPIDLKSTWILPNET
jgi:hypothetical protein